MSDKDKAKQFFQEGMSEFAGHNYGKSIELLSHTIELDPNHRLARLSRGAANLKLDNVEDAGVDFNRVIDLDPEYPRAYHLRGLAHEKSGDTDAALDDFNRAIDLDPEYGSAYYSRANLHSKMGDQDLAADDIEMAIYLTEVNIETFANQNNIWRSHHLKVEDMGAADPMDR